MESSHNAVVERGVLLSVFLSRINGSPYQRHSVGRMQFGWRQKVRVPLRREVTEYLPPIKGRQYSEVANPVPGSYAEEGSKE